MRRPSLLTAGTLLATLALAASLVPRWPEWQRLRAISGSRSVPGGAVGSTRFGRALRELGLLHPVPRGRRPDAPAAGLGPIPPRNAWIPDQLSLGRPGGSHLLASYGLQDGSLAERAPVVSLLLPQEDLKDIRAHSFLRGRQSERAAYVGFFEGGRLALSTGAGVRIHGGRSRDRKSWLAYRLTARRSYGGPVFSPAPFPADPHPDPKQLVLRPNRGRDRHRHMWHFSSPLAMDIARRAGVPAPRSRPVGFFINGTYEGVYELTDYIGPQLIEARYGIDGMVLVRTKQNTFERGQSKVKEGPEEPYEEFVRWVRGLENGIPRKRAADWVDLDNLYRWLVAVTFLDTQDVFQGALVRDLADPDARWFWIAWDLEISFGLPQHEYQDSWRRNSVAVMLKSRRYDERKRLFWWLMESPEQRRLFLETAVEILNHRLDREFLEERLAFYRRQAELFGLEDLAFLNELDDYLRHRRSAYREHLQASLVAGPARRVRVSGPPGSRLVIDGHPTELPWQGEYFDGMSLRLTGSPGSELLIDGESQVLGPAPLEITLRDDRQIALLPPT